MPPYEAEGANCQSCENMIKTRLDRLKEWVDRNLQQELPIPMHPALLPEVMNGLDRCLQYYVIKSKSGCGSRNTFVPTMPALTRCTIGSKFQGFGKKKDKSPNSQKRNPQVATNGDSSFGIPQLCVA
ncbi:hypothetical protein SESBI_22458 [Sesbania bispinosa]|nr:hypothetical protein SESBI_22458 [Sesbania bispinosa]